ncbi:MAG: hypothetical protein ACE5JS_03570 [Nitrospinota bacterium]
MAELKAVFGGSHSPLLITRADDAPREVRERVFSTYGRMGRTLIERGVEALIVFGNDHIQAFPPDRFPALAVGAAPRHRNVASEGWMPEVDGGRKGDANLGLYLANALLRSSFDPVLCRELHVDHSVVVTLHRMGDPPIPIVPILQNTVAPPLPPAGRSFDLGLAVRRALEEYDAVERVGVLATGAMSHWIGTPEMGRISEGWDQAAIDLLARGKADCLAGWSQEEIDAGGNGANEIRNWISAAAAAGNTPGKVWAYQPEPAWFTGITVMEWPVGAALSSPGRR